MIRLVFIAVLVTFACARESAPPVQAWLQPVFRDLDTLLTEDERNKLRSTDLDSAFVLRNHEVSTRIEQMGPAWQRTPAGDTLIAHGENLPKVQVNIFVDLYQQWLQQRTPDLAAALHRMSPDYVSNYRATITVDSLLLNEDVDGDGRPDRVAIEVRKPGLVAPEEGGLIERRLVLFLDTAASVKPAWTTTWDELQSASFRERYPLKTGGSILVLAHTGAETDHQAVLHVRQGVVRAVLTRTTESGSGAFTTRTAGDSIVVTATGEITIDGKPEPSSIRCRDGMWPGWQLALSSNDGSTLAQQQLCIAVQSGDASADGR